MGKRAVCLKMAAVHTVSFIQALLHQVAWEGRSFLAGAPPPPKRQQKQGHYSEEGKGEELPGERALEGAHMSRWCPLSSKVERPWESLLRAAAAGAFQGPRVCFTCDWLKLGAVLWDAKQAGSKWLRMCLLEHVENNGVCKNVSLALVGFGLMTPTCCEEINIGAKF